METPEFEIEHVKVRLYPDGRMTRRDAARYVGLSEKTLAILASKGGGHTTSNAEGFSIIKRT